MKKKLTVLSLGFIGAAILWFLCLIAAHLFFDVNIFEKDFSSFIWRFLIILLIVGISGLLLLTSVSIYEDNKTLAYISGAMILVTALFALLFFLIGKYEKWVSFHDYAHVCDRIAACKSAHGYAVPCEKIADGIENRDGVTGGAVALILVLRCIR